MRINKLLLTAAAVCCVASAKAAIIDYNPGDLLIGFTSSGAGSGQVLMIDLGPAAGLRDLNASNLNLADVGSILDATFSTTGPGGVAWYERTDLYWGAIALRSTSGGGTQSGDPALTIYASKARTTESAEGAAGSTAWNLNTSARSGAGSQIIAMENNVDANGVAYAGTTNVALMDIGPTTWDAYNPPAGTISFGQFNFNGGTNGVGIEGTFGAGAYDTLGGSDQEGALDLYRSATTGNSSYVGSLVINSSGQIGFLAVPEPSTTAFMILGGLALFVIQRRRSHCAA